MSNFNRESILDLQRRLKAKEIQPTTEEATKQWIVMPFIVALGYNPYSSDVIPEYTLDVGTKKGEKVDYALQINNQPVCLVECKQLNVQLSDRHISQLYRYFTISDVHVAVLTNGDEYWFFTDSQKENVMDLEPYFKLKLSEATEEDIDKLEQYSKDKIQYLDVAQEVQSERFKAECKDLIHSLRTHNIPAWILDTLSERSGLVDVDKSILAEYLIEEIKSEFDGYKVEKKIEKTPDKKNAINGKVKETWHTNKANRSNIKLNHEYVYNDYSDGNWYFHTLDYAIILGKKYENITGRSLLINVLTELLNQGKVKTEELLSSDLFGKTFRITRDGNFRGGYYIEEHNIYIGTSYSIMEIMKFIGKLLECAGIRDDQVIISFKE